MIRMKTDCGAITVDNAVYTNIAGYAATNCFGVKGMAVRSMTDGLVHLLRREAKSTNAGLPRFQDLQSLLRRDQLHRAAADRTHRAAVGKDRHTGTRTPRRRAKRDIRCDFGRKQSEAYAFRYACLAHSRLRQGWQEIKAGGRQHR